MNNHPPTDHPDALLDRGLTELLGGETPPDLSEKILAAVSADSNQSAVTLADAPLPLPVSNRKQWAMFALAACALIALGTFAFMNPTNQLLTSREREKSANNLNEIEIVQSPRESATVELPTFEIIHVETTISVPDRGTLLSSGVKPDWDKSSSESTDASGENLMMGVTPHTIIEEGEEEERLGTEQESEQPGIAGEQGQEGAGEQAEGQSQPFAPSSNMGLKGLINDVYSAGTPIQSNVPYVNRSFKNKGRAESDSSSTPTPYYAPPEPEIESRFASKPSSSISKDQLIKRVEQFNDLRDQQRFAEMEIVAKKLHDAAPDNPVAQQVWENAKFIRREVLGRELSGPSEQGVQVTSIDKLQSLSKKRDKDATDDFGGNVADQSIPQLSTSPEEIMIRTELGLRAAGSVSGDEVLIQDINTLIAMKERSIRERGRLSEFEKAEAAQLVADISKLREFHRRLHRVPSRDQYTPIHENPFIKADGPDAVSTFSIDVDTASYANVRQFLESGRLPPADAVRIEELVNYFDYDYAGPTDTESTDNRPFAAHMEVAECPWNKDHRLARIAIKGKEIARDERPQSNLVFLVDVSGSMNDPNKLPLLVEGMKMLTRELGENDRVAIVVYASSEGMALPSTRGDQQETILAALDQLRAGGSTAGGAGINLAYQVALDNFIEGGTNRVILCTDGDFNVGVTDTAQLEQLAIQKAKTGVFLTVLGFGRGNLNDAMMEGISGKGNGNYHYVDNLTEARKVLVEEMAGTLVTIAKDVKIQVEFNPAQVAGYRLIGYENRLLKTEDFNDDKKDAGEIGAGHTVTALYEIIPAGQEVTPPAADPLKYQQNPPPGSPGGQQSTKQRGGSSELREYGRGNSAKPQAASDELLTLKLRYKLPDVTQSTKLEFPITDSGKSFADATDDFQFAAAVASFGMLLRHSQYQGETSFDAVQEIAQASLGNDPHNYRGEFLELVRIAKELTTNQHKSHE